MCFSCTDYLLFSRWVFGFFSNIHLKHGYDWFAILILLNILFTIVGAIAWMGDVAWEEGRNESKSDVDQAGSERPHR